MSTKNLTQKKAREKYLELSRKIDPAMMLTSLGSKPVPAIPMSPKRIEDNGDVLFLSLDSSEHNKNIEKDSDTQLIFGDVKSMEFLSVYGTTTTSKSKELIADLYQKMDNNWFEGKEDPRITVLRFTPKEGHYWDTKTNALVTLAKLAYTSVTGNETEIGESGSLNL